MCEDKRATYQVVDMSGKEPTQKVSINLTAMQFWMQTFVKAAAIFAALWAGMSFIAASTFNDQLKIFHSEAKPQIERVIDSKIESHRIEAEKPFDERLHAIETHAEVTDQKLSDMERRQVEQGDVIKEINSNVLRLLENR
jgi:hypothetical protein